MMDMNDELRPVSKLLTRVPKDILDLVSTHQQKKKIDCGCRFGFEQAVYDLLRLAYGAQNA